MSEGSDKPGQRGRTWIAAVLTIAVVGVGVGLLAGYAVWRQPAWFEPHDPAALPAGEENDLIRYGWNLVIDTSRHIGRSAEDPAMRFAGNNLACTNCHLNAGLQPFAMPFVSTYASYPMSVNDHVTTLTERINGCMMRSMNGRPLPEDGREMEAFIAYIRWLGEDAPRGGRVYGMGVKTLPPAAETPSAERGKVVYEANCKRCHGGIGAGDPKTPPAVGWAVPPLWGDGSFNAGAGMNRIETAAAFIHANMPRGVTYDSPVITLQEAWDVAAHVTTEARPPAPAAEPPAAAAATPASPAPPVPPAQ